MLAKSNLAVATAVALITGVLGPDARAQSSASPWPTVAVVPFINVAGGPDDDWIGAGIAETVTADLDRFDELSVVDREALLDAVDTNDPDSFPDLSDETVARMLAGEHGISWLVTGAYQRLGDRLRITARIVDVHAGTARDSAKVDGQLDQIFALQDEVVTQLSEGLADVAGVRREPVATPRDVVVETRAAAGQDADGRGPTVRPAGRPGSGGALGGARSGGASTAVPVSAAVQSRARPEPILEDLPPAATVTGGLELGDDPLVDNPPAELSVVPPAGDAGILTGRVRVRPVRTRTPPAVDGRLDDAVWRDAAVITDFVQREPVDGAPASEETVVYLAYDSANLYLGFHAKYGDPGILRANRVDRDRAGFSDDIISVYFDTFLDQQRAYVFSVNGYGVQDDSLLSGGRGGGGFSGGGGGGGSRGIPRGDRSWDALFETGGQLVEDGFTAEMAIPFKSLRYPQRNELLPHTWGFQIVRRIRGKDETVTWSPVSRDIAGFLPQMGVLDGMTDLSTSRNLEIQPTFTAFRFGTLDENLGRVVDGDPRPEAGANFKYGLTSNLIADFTLNPDFSQIESDRPQVEVNQRFALFYPELRPFFLEGAEIFQITAPVTVVHTRTIVDPLYGAKLTGKAGKTTLGVLYANDEAAGGAGDGLSPGFDQSAQTFVGRVRYDLYSESYLGAIVTDREFLDGYSRLAGIDSNFRVGQTHQLGFRAITTDHREQDNGSRTDGYLMDFGFRKRGRNLNYSIDAYSLSPDFKTDVGFVRRTDQRSYEGRLGYSWWPQSWIISWGPELRYGQGYNFARVLEDTNFRARLRANFVNNIRYSIDVDQDMERYEGINFDKRKFGMFGNVNTSRLVSFGGGYDFGDEIYFDRANPFLGYETSFRMFVSFRPVSRFSSSINVNRNRFTDPGGFFVPGVNDGRRDERGEIFTVNLFRALNTYQFTDRLLFRNITEFDTYDETFGLNFLVTYRVNSGTAFYIGYDDHYRQRERFDDQVNVTGMGYQQTNRAIFTKFQYLFRY